MKTIFGLIFVLFSTLNLFAQNKLSGSVTDNSGKIIEFAKVYFHGTEYFCETDDKGEYSINNIAVGHYIVKVSLLGYKDFEEGIFIDSDKNLDIVLEQKTFKLKEIYINAVSASNKMPFVYKNIGKEKLEKENLGQDVPYLLKNTPSVVTTSDAGAGIGYTGIRLRGTDPTRINVTVNGIPLNDAESQQVYWVDLPDLAGSVESIQIQRGVGSSTNGAGAFGGTINVKTGKGQPIPYISLEGGLGSYNTSKISAKAGTGLMNGKYSVDVRYSFVKSDGYIDRAKSDLNSFFFSAARLFKNSSLRFNAIVGKEVTYHAWEGLPVQYLNNDNLRTYNVAGTDYFRKEVPYDNQIDDYTQNHFQLFYDKKVNESLIFNLAGHYTRGSGYYEQFKVDEDLLDYNIDTFVTANSDLVRQKWLKNDFYGLTYSLKYQNESNEIIIGGAANQYVGDHFGVVDSIINNPDYEGNQVYYKNTGTKNDVNIFLKYLFSFSDDFNAYADLQYRYVDYKIEGYDDEQRKLNTNESFNFFNPKFGLKYGGINNITAFGSFAVARKEPNRKDYFNNVEPKPENLYDIEAGVEYKNNMFIASANVYNMIYKDQLVLTGKLDDVGDPIRDNVDNSSRIGLELEATTNIKDYIQFEANATFSKNKIKEYKEYISNWDAPYTPIEIIHKDSDISFSPSLIAGAGLSFNISKITNIKKFGNLNFDVFQKFVGKQYLDNTTNENAKLDPYQYTNMGLTYSIQKGIFKNLEVSLKVNNVFSQKYNTNGWVSSKINSSEFDPTTEILNDTYNKPDPYADKINNGDNYYYHYMAFYPQALRNFMFRLKFDF